MIKEVLKIAAVSLAVIVVLNNVKIKGETLLEKTKLAK